MENRHAREINDSPTLYCIWCDRPLSEDVEVADVAHNLHRYWCDNPRCHPATTRKAKHKGAEPVRILPQPHPDPRTRLLMKLPAILNDTAGLGTWLHDAGKEIP